MHSVLHGQEKIAEAMVCYNAALAIDPHNALVAVANEFRTSILKQQIEQDVLTKKHISPHTYQALSQEMKIDQNPTHYAYAKLSKAVYDDKGGSSILPSDWELWRLSNDTCFQGDCSEEGYFGAAYRHKKTGKIVIAHRGTQLSNPGAVRADISIIFGKIPKQFESAKRFSEKIQEESPASSVSHTGHSLGALLAELCAYEDQISAVTFDSPGSKELIERKIGRDIHAHEMNVVNYLSTPNLVNTYGAHMGLMIRIFPARPVIAPPNRWVFFTLLDWVSWGTQKNHPTASQAIETTRDMVNTPEFSVFWETGGVHAIDAIGMHFDSETGRPKTRTLAVEWPLGPQRCMEFYNLCDELQKDDRDPRKNELLSKYHYRLKQTGYVALDFQNDKGKEIIPLDQFHPEIQKFLKNQLENKEDSNFYISPIALKSYKIKNIQGQPYVIITNTQLFAEDFRCHLTDSFFNATKKQALSSEKKNTVDHQREKPFSDSNNKSHATDYPYFFSTLKDKQKAIAIVGVVAAVGTAIAYKNR